ncbi:hypothetical protein LUV28_08920 [Streptomyces sp. 8ZJF_21]|nr:hypothetical protein [Streptomyces sp. 8ZJF_21]
MPSAQVAASRPSAADTEGFAEAEAEAEVEAEAGASPEEPPEGCAERDADAGPLWEGAPSSLSDPPQPATATAASTASASPDPA